MEEEMKNTLFVLLAVICFVFIETNIASADCDDTRLTCYAFCNDGPRQIDASIGRCLDWFSCNVEKCPGDPCDRARDTCDRVFAADKSCVVLTGNYYATWCDF